MPLSEIHRIGNTMGLAEERQRRILTSHVGSLPRPDALSEMMAEGKIEGPAYTKMVREAVAAVVKRQADCGIDIVDDGEQSKPGFITYIDERLGGMEPRTDNPPQLDTREKRSFPEFYCNGHSGSRPPPMICTGPVRYTGHAAAPPISKISRLRSRARASPMCSCRRSRRDRSSATM